MSKRDIVVIGASSGGVEALMRLMGDLPASVFVVVHLPQEHPSVLAHLLDRAGPLEAKNPEDGEKMTPGRVYVAPPDHHLLLEDGHVRLTRGPKENRHRPAVDALFRTAAVAGSSGGGRGPDGRPRRRDGGAARHKAPRWRRDRAGPEGCALPRDAGERAAFADVDYCLPLGKMGSLLARLAYEDVPVEERGAYPVPDDMELEAKVAGLDPSVIDGDERPGVLSNFTCPECTGPLHEIEDGKLVRFRCRVGHAYTAESMLDEKSEALEGALNVALNTLEENALMADRLADRSARASLRARRGALRGARARRASRPRPSARC